MKKGKTQLIFVLILACLAASCAGPEAKKAKYTAKAEQYMKESNWPKARVSLLNVLKIDPKDARGFYLLGEVEEKEENLKAALGDYFKAVDLKPDYKEALIKVGRFYILTHDLKNADEIAEKILKIEPGDPSAETLKAIILLLNGHSKEALVRAETAANRYPYAHDLVTFLASLYGQEGRLADAEKALKRGLEGNPNDTIILSNLADLQIRQSHLGEAENTLKKMIQIEPKEFKHRILLASFYDRNKFPEKGEEVLKEAIKNDPDAENRYLALSEFYVAHQRDPEGAEVLEKGVATLPKSAKIVFALGQLYETRKEQPKARALYEKVVQGKKSEGLVEQARARLAYLDLQEGRTAEAENRLDELLKKNPDAEEALTLKGKILMGRKEYFEAIQDFRTALKGQPERADLLALLGEAYLMAGELDLAKDSLDQSLKLNPQLWESRYNEARLEVIKGRIKEAEQDLEEILKSRPDDLQALGSLLEMEKAKKDWKASEKTLERIKKAAKDPYLIAMSQANLLVEEKKIEEARAAYGEALKLKPEASEPLTAVVRLDLARGKAKEVKEFLVKEIGAQPKNPYSHELMGELLLTEKEGERAEKEFFSAVQLKRDWPEPWIKLASMKMSEKNPAMALNYLASGIESNPGSQELILLKASTLSDLGKIDESAKTYERLIQINPKHQIAQNNLAMLLADQKGDPASINQAFNLVQNYTSTEVRDPVILDTVGWVYHKMGREEEALTALKKALTTLPNQETINYHVGMVYYKTGQFQEAKKYLSKAVQARKPFVGEDNARKVLSQLNG